MQVEYLIMFNMIRRYTKTKNQKMIFLNFVMTLFVINIEVID